MFFAPLYFEILVQHAIAGHTAIVNSLVLFAQRMAQIP
jgi:hypothetical protein